MRTRDAGAQQPCGLTGTWTYSILGNEDVPVLKRLFERARALAKDVVVGPDDPPAFAQWLKTLRGAQELSEEWEDALQDVTDYFDLSTEK